MVLVPEADSGRLEKDLTEARSRAPMRVKTGTKEPPTIEGIR